MKLRTLIVEDDDLFALLHNLQIKKSGMSEAPEIYRHGLDAAEAIEAARDTGDHFLLLLDINMPIMNAWEFLDHIQNTGYQQQVMVVIVSSSINETDRRKAFSYPQVVGFIQKPFRSEDCQELMTLPRLNPYFSQNT